MLPPFSATSTCPKCLYDRVNVRYSDGNWRNSCVYQCPEQGKGEHIERTCQRCHYQWPESCAAGQQQPAATTPSAPDEHVMVYCARCGEVSAADDEVEDDVCPRCAAPGCLSGRFTGFPPLGASEAVERYLMARAADQQQPGDGRGTRNNAVEPSVEETQANHE